MCNKKGVKIEINFSIEDKWEFLISKFLSMNKMLLKVKESNSVVQTTTERLEIVPPSFEQRNQTICNAQVYYLTKYLFSIN